MQKEQNSRQITVAEMAPHVHSFSRNENKAMKISEWLLNWIKKSLEAGTVKPYDMLPSKGDLAFHIGVSIGTIQNVFRYVEDCGFIESKQKVGTFIKSGKAVGEANKLTSKRELAAEMIKLYIKDNEYTAGQCLISARRLADIIGISNATTRMALATLITEGIIKKENNTYIVIHIDFKTKNIQTQTLVEKVASNIKNYINENCKTNTKLPTNLEFAKKFNVSVKTVHDAIKLLAKEGLLQSRRGRYGTLATVSEGNSHFYSYEKIELKIRQYIAKNCQIGDKLPPIMEFAHKFSVSTKTIKKSLDNLAEEGYLAFTRGRYGGTFVTDIPQEGNEAYKWLAISQDYISNMEN